VMASIIAITVTALLWIGIYTAPTDALNATDTAGMIAAGLQSVIALVLSGLAIALVWMGVKNIRTVRESYRGAVTSDD